MSDWVTVPFHEFPGLDLVSAPDNSGCIDMLNVDLSVRGAVRARDGYDNLTGSELTNQPDSLVAHYETDGTTQLIVGNGNRLDVLNTSGTSTANSTTPTASPHFFARFGGPGAQVTYIANGTDQVQKWNGSTFTVPAGLSGETGKFVAVTPTSNRLVIARESGSTAGNNESSVRFSEAGLTENFTADNYVDLDPGDGEAIMGLVAWGNYVFAFKESKFFVFYGETTDVTGEAIFNYRKVNSGVGLVASRAVCTARDGVYFLARTGLYKTTGGAPELVSRAVDPLFVGGLGSFYQGSVISQANITSAAMTWHNERIYLAVPLSGSSTNNRMLVFDPRFNYWLDWNIAAAALGTFRITDSTPELVFAYPTGSNHVGRLSSSYTDDDGTAIASRYRTGFYTLDEEDEKRARQMTVWGTGSVNLKMSRDFGSLDTARSLTLGTSPATGRGTTNFGKSGVLFSHEFSASSGAWRVHRAALDFMPKRSPGVKTS